MTTFAIIPGAGMSGTTWSLVQRAFDAQVLPVPDEANVPAMARKLAAELKGVDGPLVIAGASLGAMVALEIARRRPVTGLVLMAAGFGIRVGPRVLSRLEENRPGLLVQMARRGLATPTPERIEARRRDFESRAPGVLAHHLRALDEYHPAALEDPPTTVVLWGEHDTAVPFEDHLELTIRCRGALRPLPNSAHCAYLEDPDETIRWMRFVASASEES